MIFIVRLKRDISERGRDLQGVLKQYDKFVKPVSYETYLTHFSRMFHSYTLWGAIEMEHLGIGLKWLIAKCSV